MIADVVFDVPLSRPFSYRVPSGFTLAPGQRVVAPLAGSRRLGMVVVLREGVETGLKPLLSIADGGPLLGASQLGLVAWIAEQSLSSAGSTCAALLPPPSATSAASMEEEPGPGGARAEASTLLIGAGRERRVLERIVKDGAPALVVAADVDGAARWAHRLAKVDRVVRLDSGVSDAERTAAWTALRRGHARLATGTRSALLAPLPADGSLVLIDEHDPAHRPPGHPRIHSREVVLERAAREGRTALLTSATPSVEMWWRSEHGLIAAETGAPRPWPTITLADTRGILRREPLTPPVSRALRETLATGRRVLLLTSRLTACLACEECGHVFRCATCGLALAFSRLVATLACSVCGRGVELPDVCPTCAGRRLSPFGWSTERVEQAVRRRVPEARVARYDPDARRGRRGEEQRAAALAADVIVGTRGALRLFGPRSLGMAAFVTPDHLLRRPDFRAGERTFALMWAAAERVRPDGTLIVQTQNPEHYGLAALARQDLVLFYREELKFRSELGYPPFGRLAVITVRGGSDAESRRRSDEVAADLRGAPGLTVYPPTVTRHGRVRRIVVKGPPELPLALRAALGPAVGRATRGSRGIMDVEVDPVEWQ